MQVCGTSTGGILALGTCVATVPVRAMTDVYENPRRLPDRGPEAIWIKDGALPEAFPSFDWCWVTVDAEHYLSSKVRVLRPLLIQHYRGAWYTVQSFRGGLKH